MNWAVRLLGLLGSVNPSEGLPWLPGGEGEWGAQTDAQLRAGVRGWATWDRRARLGSREGGQTWKHAQDLRAFTAGGLVQLPPKTGA